MNTEKPKMVPIPGIDKLESNLYDLPESAIQFKAQFLGNTLSRYAVFENRHWDYEINSMDDRGRVNLYYHEQVDGKAVCTEKLTVIPVYSLEKTPDDTAKQIGWKVDEWKWKNPETDCWENA